MASSFDVPKRLHAAQHGAGGSDPITPADIGAATLAPSATEGLLDYTTGGAADPTPVTILSDNFSTVGELVGTTPDVGGAWVGDAGTWTSDGAGLAANGGGYVRSEVATKDVTMTVALSVVTAGTGASQQIRPGIASGAVTSVRMWASVSIASSGGLTLSGWKSANGTASIITTTYVPGIIQGQSEPQDVTLTLTLDGTTFTVAATGPGGTETKTASITEAERDALSTMVSLQGVAAAPGIVVRSISVTRPAVTPPQAEGKIVTVTDSGDLPTVVLSALDARYSTEQAATLSAVDAVKAYRSFRTGPLTVAVVSDSTGSGPDRWARVWSQQWGSLLGSDVRRVYNRWDSTASAWATPVVDNAGTPPDMGVVVTDAFNRTGAIAGSDPDVGPAWAGGAGWTANGTLATHSGTGSSMTQDLGVPDHSLTYNLSVTTTAISGTQQLRMYSDGSWPYLSVDGSGMLRLGLYGPSGSLAPAVVVAGAVSNSATPQAVKAEVTTSIQNVTVTITCAGQVTTLSGTITEEQAANRSNLASLTANTSGGTFPFAVDSLHYETALAGSPAEPPTFTVWNGSMGGAKLATFDAAKRAAMFGGLHIDVLAIAIGHNNGTQAPAYFLEEVEAWLADWRDEHPESLILVSTQSPQMPPVATRSFHAARQAALWRWAIEQRVGAVNAYAAFAESTTPDLISSDGVHPSVAGSALWAQAITDAL